jgi:hypothetical protein
MDLQAAGMDTTIRNDEMMCLKQSQSAKCVF